MTSDPVQSSISRTSESGRASGEWRQLCERYASADEGERLRILKGMNGERLQLFDLAWRGFHGTPMPVPDRPPRRGLIARIWSFLA